VKVVSMSADKASASKQKAAMKASALFDKLRVSTSLINELKGVINNKMKTIKDSRNKVNKYEEIISWMEHVYKEKCNKYQSTISSINAYYEKVIAMNSPWYVMKHWVKNKSSADNYCLCLHVLALYSFSTYCPTFLTNSGVYTEWLPHVDKLILELLANQTPPSCIQANIFAMSRVIHPEQDIVKDLSSLKHIKNLQTVLLYITNTITAY
jgi:hypothetical protein